MYEALAIKGLAYALINFDIRVVSIILTLYAIFSNILAIFYVLVAVVNLLILV